MGGKFERKSFARVLVLTMAVSAMAPSASFAAFDFDRGDSEDYGGNYYFVTPKEETYAVDVITDSSPLVPQITQQQTQTETYVRIPDTEAVGEVIITNQSYVPQVVPQPQTFFRLSAEDAVGEVIITDQSYIPQISQQPQTFYRLSAEDAIGEVITTEKPLIPLSFDWGKTDTQTENQDNTFALKYNPDDGKYTWITTYDFTLNGGKLAPVTESFDNTRLLAPNRREEGEREAQKRQEYIIGCIDIPEHLREQMGGAIYDKAKLSNIDPDILRSLIKNESNFQTNVQSEVGAYGLAQLMPGTAKYLGVDRYDISQNIQGGAKYLAIQLEEFDGDVVKALAAYNAGPGNVYKYNGVPPFEETKNYVIKNQTTMQQYKFEKINREMLNSKLEFKFFK